MNRKLVHKQNCYHDFFYFIDCNIIVQVRTITIETKKGCGIFIMRRIFCLNNDMWFIITTISLEQLTTEQQGY